MGRENNKSLSLASKRIPWDLYIPSIIVRTVTIAINNTSKKLVWWYEDSSLARKFAYVPIDETSIKAASHLIGNEQDPYYQNGENGEGYTYYYEYTAPGSTETYKVQIRLSINPYTGIGISDKNNVESSNNKWFMRICTRGNSDWTYYRLENDKWYKFHNGNEEVPNKSKKTDAYWNVKHSIYLAYNEQKKGIGTEISNATFWRKWN